MNPKDPFFLEGLDDNIKELAGMSDEELARLLDGKKAPSGKAEKAVSFEDLEPGARVRGTVLEIQKDEVLVELDRKTLGVIDLAEFGEARPAPGSPIQAEFVRYDRAKDICILSVGAVRTEIAWQELRPGQRVEGRVVEAVKGGLVLDLKGIRAFLPISQISLERVESLEPFLGQRFPCEIQEVRREEKSVVVSRRAILEEERARDRKASLAALKEGALLSGKVVRITEHGAFVNLGALDGLLPVSRIQRHFKASPGQSPLKVGQILEVEVTQVDTARGRVSLDFHRVAQDPWDTVLESYKVGDTVTGWISRVAPEGAVLSLEEGIEAVIEPGRGAPADLRAGAILKCTIASIDRARRRIAVHII